jgi:ethanolamine permease
VLGLVSFGMWGRKRLILSPEEEYALSGGLHADGRAGSHDEDPLDELLVTR